MIYQLLQVAQVLRFELAVKTKWLHSIGSQWPGDFDIPLAAANSAIVAVQLLRASLRHAEKRLPTHGCPNQPNSQAKRDLYRNRVDPESAPYPDDRGHLHKTVAVARITDAMPLRPANQTLAG